MRLVGLEGVITPVFQPIVELGSGCPLYYEALARSTAARNHRDLLAFAESYGFIQMIDAAMLKVVTGVLSRQPGVQIGVNVSVSSIERFCGQLVAGIYEHLDVADRLVVEVTETTRIEKPEVIEIFVNAAKAAGVQVAFDDYGAGHFTLDHIRAFGPGIVKVSAELIASREQRREDLAALLKLSTELGFTVVAEAIDSEAKRRDCMSLGIPYAQGFLLGPLLRESEIPRVPSQQVATPLRLAAGIT